MTLAALAAIALAFAGCSKAENTEKKPDKPAETAEKTDNTAKPDKPAESPKPAPAAGAASLADAAGDYSVDGVHSSVLFRAKHFGVAYLYGRFNKVEGTVKVDADPAKSEVQVKIATDSIFSGNKKRDDHLKGPDFLNTAQFPDLTFKSTAIKAADKPGMYEVAGELGLHGQTKPVTAMVEHTGAG
ncbi:MAG: YceI family protein, partial [Myxococcota bacterium]